MEFKDDSKLMFIGKDGKNYSDYSSLVAADKEYMRIMYEPVYKNFDTKVQFMGQDGNWYTSFEGLKAAEDAYWERMKITK